MDLQHERLIGYCHQLCLTEIADNYSAEVQAAANNLISYTEFLDKHCNLK